MDKKGVAPFGLIFPRFQPLPVATRFNIKQNHSDRLQAGRCGTAESLSPRQPLFIQLSKNRHGRMPKPHSTACRDKTGHPWGRTLIYKLYKAAFPTTASTTTCAEQAAEPPP